MAVAGRVLIKFRGNYDSTVSYSPLDAVFYPEENSTYVCKTQSLGNLPTNTTYWQIMAKGLASVAPEDIGFGYGTCTTASDTDAKIATLADYVLTVNGFVAISFTNAVNANATLNINSQGARPIYNKGVAIEDEVIEAGDTAAFVYDGTHYNLITSSGSSGHIIQGPAGTDIAKEKRMQFIDAGVTDDSTNGKTKVEVIQRVTSAQYVNAPDGIYDVYDDPGTSIDLNQLGDVNINTPLDGQGLVYDYAADEWKNTTIAPDLTSETETGNPLSFTTDSAQVAQNTVISFEPIQAGSGDPSPSNVRTISGYDSVDILASGKNLCNKIAYPISVTGNETILTVIDEPTATSYIIPVVENQTYTFSRVGGDRIVIGQSKDYPRVGYILDTLVISNNTTATFTTRPNAKYIVVVTDVHAGAPTQVQLELGSTATTYEPYNPITDISIKLNETIYSGTLDVESGKLVVTKVGKPISSQTWYYSSGAYSAYITDKKNGATNIIAEIYKQAGDVSIGDMPDLSIKGQSGSDLVSIKDSRYSGDASAFVSANGNYLIVYELATPIEIELPAHSVKLLQGANVVTTNGTSMSLTYRNGEVAKLSDLSGLANSINADVVQTSNRNLLDNPWFTVNQRQISGNHSVAFCADRWKSLRFAGGVINTTVTESGLRLICDSSDIYGWRVLQNVEKYKDLSNRRVTISVDVVSTNNSLKLFYSKSVDMASDNTQIGTVSETGISTFTFVLPDLSSASGFCIAFQGENNTDITVKSIKLELGSVSTLHLDTAPDYTTELLKCQRYFVRLEGTQYKSFGFAYSDSATNAGLFVTLPTTMRTIPTISTSGTFALYDTSFKNVTAIASTLSAGDRRFGVITLTSTGLTTNKMYSFITTSAGASIDLSAEI